MTKNNKGNLFVFEVGPSVKFVSAIKDAIFNKKNGGKFFFWKNAKLGGGGPGGVWQKTRLFPVFFFRNLPLGMNDEIEPPFGDFERALVVGLIQIEL